MAHAGNPIHGKSLAEHSASAAHGNRTRPTSAGRTAAGSNATGARRSSPLAGLKLNLNPKSPADLAPALSMLKSLYEDGKERISQLNAREKQLKQRFDDMAAK